MKGLPAFRLAVDAPKWIREMRSRGEKWSLLFRPITQVALFRGLGLAVNAGLPLEEAVKRVGKINWRNDHEMWVDVITRRGGRMITHKKGVMLTGRLIAYLIAPDLFDETEVRKLGWDYTEAREGTDAVVYKDWDQRRCLPDPVV